MERTSSNVRAAMEPDTIDRARQIAQDVLGDGLQLLSERGQTHGPVRKNMLATAALWRTFLLSTQVNGPCDLGPSDVAVMMALAKVGRIAAGDNGHRDHYLDAACYLAMAAGLVQEDEEFRREA